MFDRTDPATGRIRTAAAVVLLLTAAAGVRAATIDQQVQDHVEAAVDRGLEPTDFHHLVMASRWRNTLEDWSVVERAVDRLAAARPMDPLMSDEVRRLRAELAVESGHPSAAVELFRAAGGISAWWAVEPESIGELEDFAEMARPPGDALPWRSVAGTDPLGWVRLSGLAWPARRQMVYLAATVHSVREQPVAVRLGAAQVARAWLNGRQVLTTAQPLRHADDQYGGGGWLAAGRNLLVVAVASESDDWWLRVRLTAPDGSRLADVTERDEPPRVIAAVDRDPPEVRTLESELRRAMSRGRDGAALALAAYLVERHPQPVGAGDARSVCRAARSESPGQARLFEWLLPAEPGTRRELLEAAIDADGDLHWARIALSEWYQARQLYQEASDVLQPSARIAAVRAAQLNHEAELWGQIILPEMVDLSRRSPRCVFASESLADWAIRLARWDAAAEAVDRLAGVVPGQASVLELERRLAEDCGDSPRIRDILSESLRQDPNRVGDRIRLSRLVATDDGQQSALALVEEGLDRCPGHVELLMELAGLQLDAGATDRAAELAREVLVARPQDRRAQRMLDFLGEEAEDLGWIRTPSELWNLADSAPPGSPAVIVLDRVEVRFLPSQLTETLAQQAFLITDSARADELLTHTLPYVPERQRLRVLQARILRRDGTQVNARQSDTPRLAEPEINLFYDSRLRVFRFSELEDGDLVELAWVLSETAEFNDTGPYKGGILTIGHPINVGLVELELTAPEQLLPAWELVHIDGEPERVVDADETVHLRWRWRDLPAVPPDTPPAPRLSMTPHLVYSNHPSWSDLATWYARHVAPRVRTSRQVEETAARLTEGADDRLDKIARIYHFVTSDIRYVGLEFGEHRFRPFSADWVLNHKFGDCKDKSALLLALYDAVDIPAYMVMVRTADLGVPASNLALLEDFNHAIVYLPEDDLWLDGTASGHAPYPPPTMVQGAHVLVVRGADSAPEITPSPGGGIARYEYTLDRAEDGLIDLAVRTEDTGEAADIRRVTFAGSQDPRRVERWLQTQFPGAELVGEPKMRMIPGRDPAVMELTGRILSTALGSAGGVNAFPGEFDWAGQLTPSGERHGPLLLPVRPGLEWTLEVDLGRPPRELGPEVDLDTRFGRLAIQYQDTGAGYSVAGSFRLEPGLVEAADATALRTFLVEVERHLRRPLEVP
jgi:transglutaminase-like putative cysteine protease